MELRNLKKSANLAHKSFYQFFNTHHERDFGLSPPSHAQPPRAISAQACGGDQAPSLKDTLLKEIRQENSQLRDWQGVPGLKLRFDVLRQKGADATLLHAWRN